MALRIQGNSLLIRWLVCYKVYNSGTARWKRGIGQDIGKGVRISMSCPGMSSFQYTHTFTNLEAHQTLYFRYFYGGFIMQVWLIKSLAIGSTSSQPRSLPWTLGSWNESSNPLIPWLVPPGDQPPSLGAF